MEQLYKIKKGLDLNLEGKAQPNLKAIGIAGEYALLPEDYYGTTPRLCTKEGEHVKVGTPLLVDKATERVHIVAPVSGVVTKIVRGERRKLEQIRILADKEQEFEYFGSMDVAKVTAAEAVDYLLKSGLFAFMRQRPYDVIASPDTKPEAIYISLFSKMPLTRARTSVSLYPCARAENSKLSGTSRGCTSKTSTGKSVCAGAEDAVFCSSLQADRASRTAKQAEILLIRIIPLSLRNY